MYPLGTETTKKQFLQSSLVSLPVGQNKKEMKAFFCGLLCVVLSTCLYSNLHSYIKDTNGHIFFSDNA